jgi:hypothetical protein
MPSPPVDRPAGLLGSGREGSLMGFGVAGRLPACGAAPRPLKQGGAGSRHAAAKGRSGGEL